MTDNRISPEAVFSNTLRILHNLANEDYTESIHINSSIWNINQYVWDLQFNESIPYLTLTIGKLDKLIQIIEDRKKALDANYKLPYEEGYNPADFKEHDILSQLIEDLKEAKIILNTLLYEIQNNELYFQSTKNSETKQSEKFKFNLTVKQIAALFRILEESKFLEIPDRKQVEFAKAITSIFYSKATGDTKNMSSNSFRNHYLNPDPEALDFWHSEFVNLRQTATKKDL